MNISLVLTYGGLPLCEDKPRDYLWRFTLECIYALGLLREVYPCVNISFGITLGGIPLCEYRPWAYLCKFTLV